MEIVLTYDKLIVLCAGFAAICVAGGWLAHIITKFRKPYITVRKNVKRLDALEKEEKNQMQALSILMRSNMIILNHLRTDNNTGEMRKMEREIQKFLTNF